MSNLSVQAAAEGLPSLNRRSFLRSSAGFGAAVVVAAPHAASAAPSDLDALLSEYVAVAKRQAALEEAYNAAYERLPDWAKGGPRFMRADGFKHGDVVEWPEVAELPEIEPGRTLINSLIRPSIRDVWTFPRGLHSHLPAFRREERLQMFARVRKVIDRRREQQEEQRKLGLPAIIAEMDAIGGRQSGIEKRILATACTAAPEHVAVTALFEFFHEEDDFSMALLTRLAPACGGFLRLVVDNMIAIGPQSVRDTMLGGRA